MTDPTEQFTAAAEARGWKLAWEDMRAFVEGLLARAGRYDDTRHARLMLERANQKLLLGVSSATGPGTIPQATSISEGGAMAKSRDMQPGQREGESSADFEERMRTEAASAGLDVETYKSQVAAGQTGTTDQENTGTAR